MSVVVGLWDPATKRAVLATDSLCASGGSCNTDAIKGRVLHGLAWGSAGNAAQDQRGTRWLRAIDCAPPAGRDDVEALLVRLHDATVTSGCPATSDVPASSLVSWVVATPWGIASMDSCGAVHWHDSYAWGAGDDFATGAIHALRHHAPNLPIEALAIAAVEAASAGSIYCAPPIQLFHVEG